MPVIDQSYINKAQTYQQYRDMLLQLMAEGKTTGENQEPELVEYAKLNLARMSRIDRYVELLPQTIKTIAAIKEPQHWFVITEGWCGDAAQIVPVFNAFSTINSYIKLHILLRDQNLELMDQYLFNGTSRAIPKLIVTNQNREELFNWGPRPAALQEIYVQLKAEGKQMDELSTALHTWYATDKTVAVQREVTQLLQQKLNA